MFPSILFICLCATVTKAAPSKEFEITMLEEKHSENGDRQDFIYERGPYFEGDILLTPENFAGGNSGRWNNGQMPYIIDPRISATERNVINQAINEIHSKTCIRLIPRSTEQDYVRFAKQGWGCSSYVGKVGGEQTISLDFGCYTKKTAVHEIIHAIGFWHEQSRKDRDEWVNINWANIPSANQHNFNKHSFTDDFESPYDHGSIMHYSAYAFGIDRTIPTITSTTGFPLNQFGRGDGSGGMAASDADQINRMYGC